MKRISSSKLKLDLETICQLDAVVGGNGPAGIRTSCVPACTLGPKTGGGNGEPTVGPQSSPIHTCLPSRANCLP